MSDEFEDELNGTAKLAAAALNAPAPPPLAEAESRRRIEALMEEAALSPRVLQEAISAQPKRPWWARLRRK